MNLLPQCMLGGFPTHLPPVLYLQSHDQHSTSHRNADFNPPVILPTCQNLSSGKIHLRQTNQSSNCFQRTSRIILASESEATLGEQDSADAAGSGPVV